MAQRRMIHEKMLENAEFGVLSPNAKLLYIFSIVLADDEGRLKANAISLRGRIFAFNPDIKDGDVRKYLNEIVKKRLVTWYKVENDFYIQHPNWYKYQILRSDRKKESTLPPPNDNQMTTKGDVSKRSKRSKRSNITASLSYLKKIPDNDLDEFYNRFDCSRKAIISKAEDLVLWCDTNGKEKKNYKTFLLNALKKDFPERQEPPRKIKPVEVVEEVSGDKVILKIPEDIKNSINRIIGIKKVSE